MFVTPVVCALFNSLWGMFINLKMPDYNWTSETALVKQSLPAMAGMLGGLSLIHILPRSSVLPVPENPLYFMLLQGWMCPQAVRYI